MSDFSEQALLLHCPHCDPHSFALRHMLKETERFWIVGDVHPLCEGHILIMPKKHFSCVGAFDELTFSEFAELYQETMDFLRTTYGKASAFEHGKIGQTVFHSHVHFLPWEGEFIYIIPEGKQHMSSLAQLGDLRTVFAKDQLYLFLAIGDEQWLVNTTLGTPRFFRDRFAKVLGNPLRGDWKSMRENPVLMQEAESEIANLEKNWSAYQAKR